MELRAYKFDIKEVSDSGIIEGYASTWDEDTQGDVIEQGAFTRTINAFKSSHKPVPVLWQHDSRQPIGLNPPEDLLQDSKGLAVKARLLMDLPKAKEAHILARERVLGGLSIGFNIPKDAAEWDKQAQVRRIKEVKLFEYSLVTWPANEMATITGVKDQTLNALISELREVTALLKALHPDRSTATHEDSPNATDSDLSTLLATAETLRQEVNRLRAN